MFSRAVPALRTTLRGPPKQTLRRYTTAPTPPKSNSTTPLTLGALVAAAAAGYYYYNTTATPFAKPLPPAIPTLTGDGTWVDLPLISTEYLSPTTKLLRFALPSEDHVSGLHVASAILTKHKGPNDAKPTIRPYTPINDEDVRGHMDLLVKRYEGGPMSTHLHEMAPDQRLSVKGPIPKYEWAPNKHEHVVMIAGGTGITPMWQLMRAIFKNPEDKTKVTLVFGNRNVDEILLRKELAELENTYPQRFRAFYLLDKAPAGENWARQGYVDKALLKTVCPEPGSGNVKIFVCGPPGLYTAVSGSKKSPSDQGELTGILKELGYSKDDVYKF
ncbi:uncharacterized protein H6S33_000345 [Morchella sextelata]|uniref:uncharacterized protein n=1 Tax=Morchella sextelata TaxID=1174677 RepID=UPI001D05BBF3|nr:uncharacterized protein H6S33_000345 [Morchella sextelata]KAH0614709.1 hypothetical protein H6S33_000345 [Morchella sextelata]